MSQQIAERSSPAAGAPAPSQPVGFLNPQNVEQALAAAEHLAKSTLVPKDYQGNPGNILVAMQMGAELGLPPMQALQNVAVINGRPSLWGDAVLALVRGSGKLEDFHEEVTDEKAVCTVHRKGDSKPVVREFSMEDAKKAGLAGKSGPWQQYPKRMMQMRARSFALRDAFPDVLRGVWSAEEAQDAPMRDVTPDASEAGAEQAEKPASRTASVRDKVAQKRRGEEQGGDAPSLDAMKAAIAAAEDEAALKAAVAGAAKLPEAERDEARKAYAARLAEIRPMQIRKDLEAASGADAVDAVMQKHATGLKALAEDAPETAAELAALAQDRAAAG